MRGICRFRSLKREDTLDTDHHASTIGADSIRAAGLTVTMPRLAVWKVLDKADAPMLVSDIQKTLMDWGVRVQLSSVYAALRRMSEVGIISVHSFDENKAHYALSSRKFRHRIVCEESGKEYWPLDNDLVQAIDEFCSASGFQLRDYTLSIQAVCADCGMQGKA